jgi:hypothetical protein
MGSRANYIVIQDGKTSYHYHHWGAQRIPADFLWGAEEALSFVREQEQRDELLDMTWCEGAALIDCDQQVLLLFGGENIPYSNTLKRLYIALLRESWAGWRIRWPRYEICDVATYLDYPLDRIITGTLEEAYDVLTQDDLGRSAQWDGTLISIQQHGAISHYTMDFRALELLYQGSQILGILEPLPFAQIRPETQNHSYESVLFIDRDRHVIAFHDNVDRDPRILPTLQSKWEGWDVDEHHHGMYKHCTLIQRVWQNYVLHESEALEQLRQIVLYEDTHQPQDMIASLQKAGHRVTHINPSFFHNARPAINPVTKAHYLNAIIERWRRQTDHYEHCLATEIW